MGPTTVASLLLLHASVHAPPPPPPHQHRLNFILLLRAPVTAFRHDSLVVIISAFISSFLYIVRVLLCFVSSRSNHADVGLASEVSFRHTIFMSFVVMPKSSMRVITTLTITKMITEMEFMKRLPYR